MWVNLIGSILALVGCILIFDARRIAKKYFDFGEENLTTDSLKLFGFLLTAVGLLMMF